MSAIKILQDHTAKLTADNEYLERQIAFLEQRVWEYKLTLKNNLSSIRQIEETLEKLIPAFGR